MILFEYLNTIFNGFVRIIKYYIISNMLSLLLKNTNINIFMSSSKVSRSIGKSDDYSLSLLNY